MANFKFSSQLNKWVGASTDTKPTTADNDSLAYEYDTQKHFICESGVWYPYTGVQTTLVGSLAKGPDNNTIIIEGTDIKGKAASKPLASAYPFYTYWSIDTDPHMTSLEVSDGTNWTVI